MGDKKKNVDVDVAHLLDLFGLAALRERDGVGDEHRVYGRLFQDGHGVRVKQPVRRAHVDVLFRRREGHRPRKRRGRGGGGEGTQHFPLSKALRSLSPKSNAVCTYIL